MKKKTVLHIAVSDIGNFEGSVIHTFGLRKGYEKLLNKDYTLLIPTPSTSQKKHQSHNFFYMPNPPWIWKLGSNLTFALLIPYMLFFIKQKKPDFIYIRSFLPSFIFICLCRLTRAKIISEYNGLWHLEAAQEGKKYLAYISRICQYLDFQLAYKVRAVTPEIKSYFVSRCPAKSHKIFVVGNGADIEDTHHPQDTLAEYFSSSRPLIGFIGNFRRWQGIDLIVEAAQIVHQKHSRCRFILVGDGSEMNKIKLMIHRAGIENIFLLPGRVDHKTALRYVSQFDVALAPFKPDRLEITGNSALKIREYASRGKAIICSDIDGYDVDIKQFALTFRRNDSRDLAHKILCLIQNQTLHQDIAQRALAFAKKNFSWEAIAKKIYKNIIADM